MKSLFRIFIYLTVFFSLTFACIKPYQPELKPGEADKYVVTGQISNQEAYQVVNITKSSIVTNPQYIPVAGCTVTISDNLGNNYQLEDSGDGNYQVWMNQDGFSAGNSYMVHIITPSGDEIESDYDLMPESPPVDSVYYIREDHLTNDPESPDKGVQFYIDMNGTANDSRYYRWELIETWEYHSDYNREWYYDGSFHHVEPVDHSLRVCWVTSYYPDFFTLSTSNLAENSYMKFPLNFVDNKTFRLKYMYSLLVKQYGLSETAFEYWEKLRKNNNANGGLYNQQPLPIVGNLHNITNPDEEVLGYFCATSMSSKRIFVKDVPDLENETQSNCPGPMILGHFGWREFGPEDYPVYYVYVQGFPYILNDECVDCRLSGGVNIKPDYWPD